MTTTNLLLGKYTQIEAGKVEEGKKQMAFIIPFTLEGKPYKGYEGVSEKIQNMEMPLVLSISRWDGLLGFAGGFVEEGETPKQGVIREAYEELGFKVDETKLKPHRTFSSKSSNIHSFVYECSEDDLKEMQRSAITAPHALAETAGVNIWQLFNNGKKNTFQNLLDQNWSATAGLELEGFFQDYKLYGEVK